jgi:glycine cleavage system aminomethyltransferase T
LTEAAAVSRPEAATDKGPNEPVMRSVVHRKHAALGATFERRRAWSVPVVYGSGDQEIAALRSTLGFADISARGKLHLSGAVDDHIRSLTGAGIDPLHTAPVATGGTVARIAGDWALALLAPSAEADALRSLEHQQAEGAMAADVTGAHAGFLVAGPRLDDFLARTVAIDPADLRPGRCTAASWARIPAILVIKDLSEPAVEIYVSSDYGRYAWDVLQSLAGSPVGWRALESWGWK